MKIASSEQIWRHFLLRYFQYLRGKLLGYSDWVVP